MPGWSSGPVSGSCWMAGMLMDVLLASSNAHKAAEFRRIFAGSALRLLLPSDLRVASLAVAETGRTFAENAALKAQAYAQAYRIAALADDSGISVDALAGAPGIRSARFGAPDLDDAGRVRYLLECLATIPEPQRGAHYTCALVLALPGEPPVTAHGYLYGRVAASVADGGTGFGYDPVFYLPVLGRTVSEIAASEKDRIGHRGRAARALVATLAATLEV